jgi:hypothetical protein
MVMDMGRDAAAGQDAVQGRDAVEGRDVVELVYRPTAQDYAAALRERRRASRAGRLQQRLFVCVLVCMAVDLAIQLAQGEVPVLTLVWLPVFGGLFALLPRLQARQLMRAASLRGTCRATVTDDGLTVANDHGSSTIAWSARPRYRETADLFVFFSDDRYATCFSVLPKRGLAAPADADRLRAVLERHLARA